MFVNASVDAARLQAEAEDPKTSARRLAAMAREHSADHALLARIAKNPSTTLKTLFELASRVPADVLASPAFSLFSMGGSAAFAQVPPDARLALLAQRDLPPEMQRWYETRVAPGDGGEVVHRAESVARTIALGRSVWSAVPVASLELLARALSPSAPIPQARLTTLAEPFHAHYRHTPPEVLEQLTESVPRTEDFEAAMSIVHGIASHPNATPLARTRLVELCAKSKSAKHPLLFEDLGACASFVEEMLNRPWVGGDEVRAVAGLRGAGDGRDGVVRGAWRAALRRGLLDARERAALLEGELAGRLALATSVELEASEQERLAADTDHRVRLALLRAHPESAALHQALAADPVPAVAEIARRSLHLTPAERQAGLEHPRRAVRRVAAETMSPADLAAVVDRLVAEPDGRTRLRVAERKDAPEAVLRALAKDASPTIRRAVAKNPSTPQDAWAALADDPDPRVREGLALRRKRP